MLAFVILEFGYFMYGLWKAFHIDRVNKNFMW